MRIGRSSSSPQPPRTIALATALRMSAPCALSISKPAALSRVSERFTRETPGMDCSARCTSSVGPCAWTNIVTAPRKRSVSASGVSVATTLPLLMITTFWQVCATSGRMCVLKTMV